MGHPKKQKKKYETPKRPYDKQRIESERKILFDYGLRRKHEIWRTESILRDFRRRARELLSAKDEKKQKELIYKLNKLGIETRTLDDVLTIKLDHILGRRLQTIVSKKGIANTPKQARQFVVHGHILIDGKKVAWPSYLVSKDEEDKIKLKEETAKRIMNAQTVKK